MRNTVKKQARAKARAKARAVKVKSEKKKALSLLHLQLCSLAYKEKNGSSCGTPVGWTRARQLANREPLTRDTIARMASFERHRQNSDVPYSEGCGGVMWDAWGGTSGVEWAINKLKEIDN